MTGKYVLPEQDLLEKAAELKRFEYSPICKELNAQISAAEKQYKKLGKDFEFNKKEEKMKNIKKSNLVYRKGFTL